MPLGVLKGSSRLSVGGSRKQLEELDSQEWNWSWHNDEPEAVRSNWDNYHSGEPETVRPTRKTFH